MTRLFVLPLLILLAAACRAQEPVPESLPLIPEPVAPAPKPKPASRKRSSTEQASDDLQTRIRLREAKTKALANPQLQVEWNRAHAARTQPERRELLRSYYEQLYSRMEKIDPTLKPRMAELRKSLAWRVDAGAKRAKQATAPPTEREFDVE
jgi:hypothetical protein